MPEPRHPARLVVGNLDVEVELTRAAGAEIPAPRRAVTEMISVAASTLSVFAGPGDRLWTPAPIDPVRVPAAADGVVLVSGPLAAQAPVDALLAWGEAPSVAALRPSDGAAARVDDDAPWPELLWQLHPTVDAALAGNHRGFAHRLAGELGLALPGARMIDSAAALAAHLEAGGAREGDGAWVVKAAYSAAGRERVRERGVAPAPDRATRIARLLARGPLLFEPWVDRVADVGVAGLVVGETLRQWPPHRLATDASGVFRGIDLVDGEDDGLRPGEREAVTGAARAAGRALADAGYRGPFGIDAFVYRSPDGERRLAALGEINARLTFGHVARAHAEAAGLARARFALGRGPAPDGATVLARPAAPDQVGAWLTTW